MSEINDGYRTTGLVIVALAIFLIAFDLAFFALCNSGEKICLSWSTNRVSDVSLILFFGLFLVGIGILAWPAEPGDPETTATEEPEVAPGAAGTSPARSRRVARAESGRDETSAGAER